MTALRPYLLVPALALVAACASTSKTTSTSDSPTAKSDSKSDSKADAKAKDDAEEKAEKLKKKERELTYARAELKIARLGEEADVRESKSSIEECEHKLSVAMKDRDNFKKVEQPMKLTESQLGYDRAAQRMKEAQEELNELKSMYKQEEIATLTKELVLSRGEANLAFAKRSLELEQQRMANLRDHDLAKKQKEVDLAVEKAERTLKEAKEKQTKSVAEAELKRMKGEHKIDEIETEIAKLKKDAAKAEEKKETAKAEPKKETAS